jgi:large subunit ribosomal protein L15
LEKLDVELIDLEVLKSKKIISNKIKEVKVINGGELTKALKLKGIKASKTVAELIVKLGGELS